MPDADQKLAALEADVAKAKAAYKADPLGVRWDDVEKRRIRLGIVQLAVEMHRYGVQEDGNTVVDTWTTIQQFVEED